MKELFGLPIIETDEIPPDLIIGFDIGTRQPTVVIDHAVKHWRLKRITWAIKGLFKR